MKDCDCPQPARHALLPTFTADVQTIDLVAQGLRICRINYHLHCCSHAGQATIAPEPASQEDFISFLAGLRKSSPEWGLAITDKTTAGAPIE